MPTIVVGDQEIPDVRGLEPAAAIDELENAGFFSISVAEDHVPSDTYGSGTIAEQDPAPEVIADPAITTVTLTISSGPVLGAAAMSCSSVLFFEMR